jgi:uncharacterized membrane protein YkgB
VDEEDQTLLQYLDRTPEKGDFSEASNCYKALTLLARRSNMVAIIISCCILAGIKKITSVSPLVLLKKKKVTSSFYIYVDHGA